VIGYLPTFLFGTVVLASSPIEYHCDVEIEISPPRNEQEALEIMRWLEARQIRGSERPPQRKAATLRQALERRQFDRPTVQEVVERELSGKNLEEVERVLKNLGFRGGPYLYGWNEPQNCNLPLYRTYIGLTVQWSKGIVSRIESKILMTGP
jgi:hypothetical protein